MWNATSGLVTVFGFPVDLDIVTLLYESLSVQASSALTVARADGKQFRSRAFRKSFLLGYAVRVGERLREARAREEAAASARHGDALLPALWDRRSAVDAAQQSAFPDTSTQRLDRVNLSGWAAGTTAANDASLDDRLSLTA